MILSVRHAEQRWGFPVVLLQVFPTNYSSSVNEKNRLHWVLFFQIHFDGCANRQTDMRWTGGRTDWLTVQPYRRRLRNAQSIFVSETVRSLNSILYIYIYLYHIHDDAGAGDGSLSNIRGCLWPQSSVEDGCVSVPLKGWRWKSQQRKMHVRIKNNNNNIMYGES